MNKLLSAMLILAISLLLFGCGGTQTTNNGKIYVGGTSGLQFVFNTPFGSSIGGKDIVYEQSDTFNIEVNVKNMGEYDIKAGDLKLKLTGVKVSDFTNLKGTAQNLGALNKIEKGIKLFNEEDITFKTDVTKSLKYAADVTSRFDPPVTAWACYPYTTELSSTICFKSNKNTLTTCSIEGAKEFDNSGAPLQVTAVTQTPGNSKVTVIIEVKNVGTGKIYKISSKACSLEDTVDAPNRENANKFTVEVMKGGLVCDGTQDSPIRIKEDGTATIRCEKTITNDEAYADQLTLKLNYQYEQWVEHAFTICDEDADCS
ncbi:MAG: hypothetical protein WC755_05775 [Candidatus Woesearchaeota archaeon]|jgi:hypothetical protein